MGTVRREQWTMTDITISQLSSKRTNSVNSMTKVHYGKRNINYTKHAFEKARVNMEDFKRRQEDRESCRSKDFDDATSNSQEDDENIYAEPIFDDDSTEDENVKEVKTSMTTTNQDHTGRIAVLDNIPTNYVLFAPKAGLACGEGVISCTLVPRELVGNMVTVRQKAGDQEDLRMTPIEDTHRRSNIEYIRNEEQCINEDTKDQHDKNEDGYSEHDEQDELEKMQYNHALLNLISVTSLEIKKCHDDTLIHSHSRERRQKPKRSPSKVSSFLGNIFGGPQHRRRQRYSKRTTSR